MKYQLIRMPEGETIAGGVVDHAPSTSAEDATAKLIDECRALGIDAVGHRIVHGGSLFREPVMIDHAVIDRLRALRPLDPLHNPAQVALVDAAMKLLPDVPHVAAFDTAFHRTLPDIAALYALPRDLSERYQLRRYGFHGLSYAYVSRALLVELGRDAEGTRLIVCHLGNGASVCAVRDGKSVDTSMGLTPLEGLVMGTRSGDVDPGLLFFLLREQDMSAADLDAILNDKSGLLGLSGLSSDVRELQDAAPTNAQAAFALDAFAYRVRKYIGAYAAAMGGVDAVAFTGGIGEHSASMRARICAELGFLGIALDPWANAAANGKANASIGASTVGVWVIPTNEELEIARSVEALRASS